MFVRIYAHISEKGKEEQGKSDLAKFSEEVDQSPESVASYKMVSQTNPANITTVTIWKSKEAWQEWNDARKAKAKSGGAPTLWEKVEGDNFDTY